MKKLFSWKKKKHEDGQDAISRQGMLYSVLWDCGKNGDLTSKSYPADVHQLPLTSEFPMRTHVVTSDTSTLPIHASRSSHSGKVERPLDSQSVDRKIQDNENENGKPIRQLTDQEPASGKRDSLTVPLVSRIGDLEKLFRRYRYSQYQILLLLIKNSSKAQEDRLMQEELEILKNVRLATSDSVWDQLMAEAKRLKSEMPGGLSPSEISSSSLETSLTESDHLASESPNRMMKSPIVKAGYDIFKRHANDMLARDGTEEQNTPHSPTRINQGEQQNQQQLSQVEGKDINDSSSLFNIQWNAQPFAEPSTSPHHPKSSNEQRSSPPSQDIEAIGVDKRSERIHDKKPKRHVRNRGRKTFDNVHKRNRSFSESSRQERDSHSESEDVTTLREQLKTAQNRLQLAEKYTREMEQQIKLMMQGMKKRHVDLIHLETVQRGRVSELKREHRVLAFDFFSMRSEIEQKLTAFESDMEGLCSTVLSAWNLMSHDGITNAKSSISSTRSLHMSTGNGKGESPLNTLNLTDVDLHSKSMMSIAGRRFRDLNFPMNHSPLSDKWSQLSNSFSRDSVRTTGGQFRDFTEGNQVPSVSVTLRKNPLSEKHLKPQPPPDTNAAADLSNPRVAFDDTKNVLVFARCRPIRANQFVASSVAIESNYSLEIESRDRSLTRHYRGSKTRFDFDRVYGPMDDNSVLCNDVSSAANYLLNSGQKLCFLAYGERNAGKTWSLRGDQSDPGLIMYMAKRLFAMAEHRGSSNRYKFSVTAASLWGECFHDLLYPSAHGPRVHPYRTGKPLTHMTVDNMEQLETIWEMMELNREPFFSGGERIPKKQQRVYKKPVDRAHLIMTIHVEATNTTYLGGFSSKMVFVDLADSGQLHKDKGGGPDALLEFKRNLTQFNALAQVLTGISRSSIENGQPVVHIPYRNSNLTTFLQDSLQPGAIVRLYLCCMPDMDHHAETLRTLKYGARVRHEGALTRNRSKSQSASGTSMKQGDKSPQEDSKLEKRMERLLHYTIMYNNYLSGTNTTDSDRQGHHHE